MNVSDRLIADLEKHLGVKKAKISEDRQIHCERTIVSICNDADELVKIVKRENPIIDQAEIDALTAAVTQMQTVILLYRNKEAA